MNKFILSLIVTTFILSAHAQNFGLRAGVDIAIAKDDFDGISISDNETGFYIGAFKKFGVSESFKIRMEDKYFRVKNLDQIQIPILAEIGMSDKFNVVAGPIFGLLLVRQ